MKGLKPKHETPPMRRNGRELRLGSEGSPFSAPASPLPAIFFGGGSVGGSLKSQGLRLQGERWGGVSWAQRCTFQPWGTKKTQTPDVGAKMES